MPYSKHLTQRQPILSVYQGSPCTLTPHKHLQLGHEYQARGLLEKSQHAALGQQHQIRAMLQSQTPQEQNMHSKQGRCCRYVDMEGTQLQKAPILAGHSAPVTSITPAAPTGRGQPGQQVATTAEDGLLRVFRCPSVAAQASQVGSGLIWTCHAPLTL